jgi:D-methionine transport system ATP-binding protein
MACRLERNQAGKGVIVVDGISKRFAGPPHEAASLRNVSLHIEKGEVFGLAGRPGAGASTVLRCMNLLIQPDAGRVAVDGRDLTTLSGAALRLARQDIGTVFKRPALLTSRTVQGNIALPLELKGTPKTQICARLDTLIYQMDLGEIEDAYTPELSREQSRKVAIARALAGNPKILLCDEPTSGLDQEAAKSILSLLKSLNGTFGLTVVFASHDMQAFKEIADRVAVFDNGEVIEAGRTFDILTAPVHDATQSLVRAAVRHEMPEHLHARIGKARMAGDRLAIRITFTGPAANEPILSDMIRRFNLSFNILYGHVEYIQGAPYGSLAVEMSGSEGSKQAALDFLRANNLKVEILGRVLPADYAIA